MNRPVRLIRRPETELRSGLRRSQLDLLERRGEFPKRIKISERASGWLEHEVDDWIAERVAASRNQKIAA